MRDIKLCHPELQKKAKRLLDVCREQGIIIQIGETLRTTQEQDELYAQGRTKPGAIVTNARGSSYSSMHQWGVAFDFYLAMDVDGDGKTGDDAYNDSTGLFKKVGKIGEDLGLEWGGNWKSIVDKPHFQLPDWGSTPKLLKETYHTPTEFMKTWKHPAGWVKDAGGWWYRNEDGTYAANSWEKIDGTWYWFDGAGYMVADAWKHRDDQWYYLKDSGAMAYSEILVVHGEIYCFAASGALMEGQLTLHTNDRGALVL